MELLCQEVLVDGPQDLQGQLHGILLPVVAEQQSGQLHWPGCLELASGYPGVLLLQAGVLQLELELLKVIGHQLLQGVQKMVTRGLGHGVDQKSLEPAVWLLGAKKLLLSLSPGTEGEEAACEITEKAQEMLCALVGTEVVRGDCWLVFPFSQIQRLFQLGGLNALPHMWSSSAPALTSKGWTVKRQVSL